MKVGSNKTWFYVLEQDRDRPVAERTVWELKPLSVADNAAALDSESRAGVGSGLMVRVINGLVGWKNLTDSIGAEISFEVTSENVVKMELLDRIVAAPGGWSALIELSGAIRNHLEWTEDERKNSDSPPSSSPETSKTSGATSAALNNNAAAGA